MAKGAVNEGAFLHAHANSNRAVRIIRLRSETSDRTNSEMDVVKILQDFFIFS